MSDTFLGHIQPLPFWGWTGVNCRDSFLQHQENKWQRNGTLRSTKLLLLSFPRLARGVSQKRAVGHPGWCPWGYEGQGWMLDTSPASGEVWQEALAAGSHRGWEWDRALDTGPAGKSRAQTERGAGECDPGSQARTWPSFVTELLGFSCCFSNVVV